MKKILMTILIIITISFLTESYTQEKMTAEEILKRRDENMAFESAYTEVEMIITIGNRVNKKELISYSEGTEKSFIEFLSPARDKGTKMLKIGKVLKIYFPSAERVMRLSGHMLRQSMMGSDFSYEDLTETAEELREEYEVKLQGEENFEGTQCYVLELESKVENKTYFFQKIWMDKEKLIGLKVELYAKSGKLLKVMRALNVQSFKKRYYPTKIVMEDKLRKNSKTEMILKKIDFDIPISPNIFSERNLMRR
ncbi:MAG: outer membrane lipoprotein-sorting protein [Candidatus Aminicenantes bacterium]|nr:MAG: outer membrane lipoprotein-sorting protein [Candidatus Aminicenantes bacterium]